MENPEIAFITRDATGNVLINENGFITCTSTDMKLIIKIRKVTQVKYYVKIKN